MTDPALPARLELSEQRLVNRRHECDLLLPSPASPFVYGKTKS